MSKVLEQWNLQDRVAAAREVLPCCGSVAWAEAMAAARPFVTADDLFRTSDVVWWGLPEAAWQEAFGSHPRIGERHAAGQATAEALQWSEQEQQAVGSYDGAAAAALDAANRRYEERFGRIFIVCASGRSASEISGLLEARMSNDPQSELRVATEEHRQITQLRLRRWLEGR